MTYPIGSTIDESHAFYTLDHFCMPPLPSPEMFFYLTEYGQYLRDQQTLTLNPQSSPLYPHPEQLRVHEVAMNYFQEPSFFPVAPALYQETQYHYHPLRPLLDRDNFFEVQQGIGSTRRAVLLEESRKTYLLNLICKTLNHYSLFQTPFQQSPASQVPATQTTLPKTNPVRTRQAKKGASDMSSSPHIPKALRLKTPSVEPSDLGSAPQQLPAEECLCSQSGKKAKRSIALAISSDQNVKITATNALGDSKKPKVCHTMPPPIVFKRPEAFSRHLQQTQEETAISTPLAKSVDTSEVFLPSFFTEIPLEELFNTCELDLN